MTTNIARKLLLTTAIGLGLALGACGQGGKDDKTAAKDGKDAKGKAGDAKTDAKKGDVKAETKAGDKPEPEQPLDDRVIKAAGLAKKIAADPSKTDDILAEAGLDRAGLEALMFEISTPELADQYRLARAREQG